LFSRVVTEVGSSWDLDHESCLWRHVSPLCRGHSTVRSIDISETCGVGVGRGHHRSHIDLRARRAMVLRKMAEAGSCRHDFEPRPIAV
jgi:hypothetical protein